MRHNLPLDSHATPRSYTLDILALRRALRLASALRNMRTRKPKQNKKILRVQRVSPQILDRVTSSDQF